MPDVCEKCEHISETVFSKLCKLFILSFLFDTILLLKYLILKASFSSIIGEIKSTELFIYGHLKVLYLTPSKVAPAGQKVTGALFCVVLRSLGQFATHCFLLRNHPCLLACAILQIAKYFYISNKFDHSIMSRKLA